MEIVKSSNTLRGDLIYLTLKEWENSAKIIQDYASNPPSLFHLKKQSIIGMLGYNVFTDLLLTRMPELIVENIVKELLNLD